MQAVTTNSASAPSSSNDHWSAPIALRIAYALALITCVLPVGLAQSGWVVAATGGGFYSTVPFIGPLLFLMLGLYRALLVVRSGNTLDCPKARGFLGVLRTVGIAGIFVGAAIGLLNWFSVPLTKATLGTRTGTGVEYFLVGFYLSMLSGIGLLGLVVFELSRLRAFEKR